MKKGLLYSLIGFAMIGGLILPSKVFASSVILPTSGGGDNFHVDISGVDHDGVNDGIYVYDIYRGTYPDTSVLYASGSVNVNWGSICRPLSGTDCVLSSTTPGLGGFNGGFGLPDGNYWYYLQIFHSPSTNHEPHGVMPVTFISGSPTVTDTATTTHFNNLILSTTTQTVRFTGYISPDNSDVHLIFNVSTPLYSQWDHADILATTTGFFDQSFPYTNFSTSTIDRFTFTGTLETPHACFTDCDTAPPAQVYDTISTSTNSAGIGVTHLPTPPEIDLGVAQNCNPLNTVNFNVAACATYLFFPDPEAAGNNVARIRDTLLTKLPLGYFTRLYTILTSSATTTIPGFTYTWGNDGGPLDGKSFTFNTDDNLAQAKGLTDEMVSNTSGNHKTAWQILEPFINMFLAIFVLYAIIHDVMALDLIHHKR